ncbi:methyltransferase [Dactylosporangium sp. NPDC048998]|uniref:methyltransferase n=1 Tax=Dactylosporangium sp. NPDC048998 TaxID=3363976 RepID=UPI003717655B
MARTDLDAAGRVVELITGGWRAQAVYTAARMRLPDLIAAGSTTAAELAAAAGAEVEGVRRLMRLLVAMEVFDGDERGYRNTPASLALMDEPESLRDMCLLYGEEFYTAWGQAYESIRTVRAGFEIAFGQALYPYLGTAPDLAERFQAAMRSGNLFFDYVPDVFDFAGKTVADLGGGPGRLLMAVLGAVPDARGILLDREHVVPIAKANLAATVGLERIEFVAADMFETVPAGADVYVLCRVLAGHSDDAVAGLFAACRRAMDGPDGRLMILERVVTDEGGTVLPALWDLHLLMTNGGRHRSLDTFRALLDRAGLDVERVVDLPMETTAIIAAPRG